MKNTHRSLLLSIMGGQAQVVTFALDALLAQGEDIAQVIVLHLSPEDPRVQRALAQLSQEFSGDFYAYAQRPCRFRHVVLRDSLRPLRDIQSEADAIATWQVVHEILTTLKSQQWRVHLCLAGGRRMISLLAMSVAMLLFDHYDRLWHMYTPREFLARAREGAIMHAQPEDGVRLIPVPLTPWGTYFPALRALAQAPTGTTPASLLPQIGEGERRRCQSVIDRLTPRQREILRAFASGKKPQEVAEELFISLKTVDSHKTVILSECRNAWNVADGVRLDYHFLHDKFGLFFKHFNNITE